MNSEVEQALCFRPASSCDSPAKLSPRVGIYIDVFNISGALNPKDAPNNGQYVPIDLHALRVEAARHGRICIARAYFDTRAPEAQDAFRSGFCHVLASNGFEPVPVYRGRNKNSHGGSSRVDMKMAADMLEDVLEGRIDLVVLVSGDSDFSEHIWKARRHGARVILISPPGSTAVELENMVDQSIPYEGVAQRAPAPAGSEES